MSSVVDVHGGTRLYRDPNWYTPPELPREVQAFDTPVALLGVGSSGKVGLLDLELAPVGGATRVVRQFQQMPLYLYHPIYLDPGRPDLAFIFLLQGGGGMLQGDRYRLDLTCQPGSAVHFTTQAASKIYRMEHNFATQIINLSAGADSYVEYLPDPVIPYRDSRFYQRFRVSADPSASLILGETLLPGRVARGESHAYTLYYSDLEVRSPDGSLIFADRIVFDPAELSPRSPSRLGPFDVLSTFYVISRRRPPQELAGALHDALAEQVTVLAGVSTLPNEAGVVVRLLGPGSLEIARAFNLAWNTARQLLIGVPAPDLRKG